MDHCKITYFLSTHLALIYRLKDTFQSYLSNLAPSIELSNKENPLNYCVTGFI